MRTDEMQKQLDELKRRVEELECWREAMSQE